MQPSGSIALIFWKPKTTNMRTISRQESTLIKSVTERLTENFFQALYQISPEKNFYVRIGLVTEIVNWSWEFFHLHHDKFRNVAGFLDYPMRGSAEVLFDEAVFAFGRVKFENYCAENISSQASLLEKYMAFQS
jgi:hypothetical protein